MNELNEQDYQSWRHHPVTKIFHQYLRDYVSLVERAELANWRAGERNEVRSLGARGQVQACEEMVDLKFEDIEAFYREPTKTEE